MEATIVTGHCFSRHSEGLQSKKLQCFLLLRVMSVRSVVIDKNRRAKQIWRFPTGTHAKLLRTIIYGCNFTCIYSYITNYYDQKQFIELSLAIILTLPVIQILSIAGIVSYANFEMTCSIILCSTQSSYKYYQINIEQDK